MKVAVIGLGLIGGSMAKAYKQAGHEVSALDIDKNILEFAKLNGDIDNITDKRNIKKCDLIIIALYPEASINFLKEYSPFISKAATVIDCCGTKRLICDIGFSLSKEHGFTFVGGHPMAGTHNSGYKYSRADMFNNAPMVIVPDRFDDIKLLDNVKQLLTPCGFKSFSVTTAEKHDEMIAFTSQMAHIVSNAFIKSPTAVIHKGFSAGSYKDLTRVAWLNPVMWSELFFENKDFLISELDILIKNLNDYKTALKTDDKEFMIKLLDEGKRRKEEVDG